MTIYAGDNNNIARTIEKRYVGDNDNIARTVIRAYAGDENNIARMVFGSPLRQYIIQDGAMASDAYWVRQATPRYESDMTTITPSGEFKNGYYDIYFTGNKSGNLKITNGSQNNLDFTKYRKICIDYRVSNEYVRISLSLQAAATTYIINSEHLLDYLNSTTRTTVEFDISNVTGMQYFYLNMRFNSQSSSNRHAYIYNLWIE